MAAKMDQRISHGHKNIYSSEYRPAPSPDPTHHHLDALDRGRVDALHHHGAPKAKGDPEAAVGNEGHAGKGVAPLVLEQTGQELADAAKEEAKGCGERKRWRGHQCISNRVTVLRQCC